MNSTEVLELVDDLIFAKTRKHLEDLQKDVLKGTIEGKAYPDIAKDSGFSESHVKNFGKELWNLLSLVLGEKVNKANFKGVFRRIKSHNFSQLDSRGCKNNPTINNINIFPEQQRPPTSSNNYQETKEQPPIDLAEAPEIFNCYDRSSELTILESWILKDSSRLIALLGISGIGKTTLTLQLIKQIKTNFNYIIYRSLRFSPSLDTTLAKLLEIFSEKTDICQNIETQISQLLNYLRQYRCLIILMTYKCFFVVEKWQVNIKLDMKIIRYFFNLLPK